MNDRQKRTRLAAMERIELLQRMGKVAEHAVEIVDLKIEAGIQVKHRASEIARLSRVPGAANGRWDLGVVGDGILKREVR